MRAGYSEGAIYKHFESKEELFICVLTERLPSFVEMVQELPGRVGEEDLGDVLGEVGSAVRFLRRILPYVRLHLLGAGVAGQAQGGDQEKRCGTSEGERSLRQPIWRRERNLGRVREDADPESAAAMVLGACFQRAFFKSFFGESSVPGQEEVFVEGIVRTLMPSLSPSTE